MTVPILEQAHNRGQTAPLSYLASLAPPFHVVAKRERFSDSIISQQKLVQMKDPAFLSLSPSFSSLWSQT